MSALPLQPAPAAPIALQDDRRPRMFEPPPVRLITVADAHLLARAGVEPELDWFYVTLLGFERDGDVDFPAYRGANFRILFDVLEPPIRREDFRILGIEVSSLAEIEQQLSDCEIKFTRHRSLLPGLVNLLLRDPAGNWLEISESRTLG